jgi:flagellar hook-associated protein 3 FlgL
MDATIDALMSPTVSSSDPTLRAALLANLDGTDTSLSLISGKVAKFGGAQTVLSTLDTNHGNVSLSNKTAMTDLGQLDYGLAATSLNGYQNALQATYQAYAKVSGLSLFNVL